ncbi:MAG: glucose-1-phosphate cytidylyltransferase [Flavobacteriales bacterium]|nr:glucose-1-phosphate cytidylyltransferase [Flavobacteriales bacterium]|tara:strand:+ start:31 stop:804 length:774 start_codon:yes stop_codon:yes gene_type:complete
MKAVILAGGFGTRISEETHLKPKPMVEIQGRPILWHIMKIYSFYGVKEFIICLGYKGYIIKEYFSNFLLHQSDVELNLKNDSIKLINKYTEDWKITLVDTGNDSMTGGRLKRVKPYLDDGEDFFFTYGDGLSDINLNKLFKFHKNQKTLATLSAVYPPGRFGALEIDEENKVTSFKEKPRGDGGLINGGFFILSPKVIDYIEDDFTIWEQEPLINLAKDNELSSYIHAGFWHPMDTLRDKNYLNDLYKKDKAPWKIW